MSFSFKLQGVKMFDFVFEYKFALLVFLVLGMVMSFIIYLNNLLDDYDLKDKNHNDD